eukprot:CAMPEP_0204850282 /NCGR_PEP_ID=MMETSP1347-20130617/7834_1 /ASSEMBLY_ACC=CAM_ASM_000690 /TAXON_ID=215587 /ORGANISM="Aplanochytrium stocchinoi, Strain GSBS06" /LENGTH=228 /DNA_ID=CAMNT_0051993153 /DNA_START=63 /DNA_END=746 /DNA_ORIENTATION=+
MTVTTMEAAAPFMAGQVYSLVPNTIVQSPPANPGVQLPQFDKRLLQVKGRTKNTMALTEVPVRLDCMNEGDVFILDTFSTLYQWNGMKSNEEEKEKAREWAKEVIENRGLPYNKDTHVEIYQGQDVKYENKMMQQIKQKSQLFGNRGPVTKRFKIQDAKYGGKDEKVRPFEKKLYMVKVNLNKKSKAKVAFSKPQVAKKKNKDKSQYFSRNKLNSGESFVMDDGFHVW